MKFHDLIWREKYIQISKSYQTNIVKIMKKISFSFSNINASTGKISLMKINYFRLYWFGILFYSRVNEIKQNGSGVQLYWMVIINFAHMIISYKSSISSHLYLHFRKLTCLTFTSLLRIFKFTIFVRVMYKK